MYSGGEAPCAVTLLWTRSSCTLLASIFQRGHDTSQRAMKTAFFVPKVSDVSERFNRNLSHQQLLQRADNLRKLMGYPWIWWNLSECAHHNHAVGESKGFTCKSCPRWPEGCGSSPAAPQSPAAAEWRPSPGAPPRCSASWCSPCAASPPPPSHPEPTGKTMETLFNTRLGNKHTLQSGTVTAPYFNSSGARSTFPMHFQRLPLCKIVI